MSHIQEQEWHHRGSACCSPCGTCVLSCCCPCITYGRTHHRVKNDGNMQGYSCCNLSCAAFCGLSCLGLSFILPMISRGDIRAKYHLQGNGCKDCLCACCCTPCDLTQQDKEATWRESQRKPNEQPQRMDPMQYKPQNNGQPAFHH
ncbi:PLAC8-domain-containing protein [Melanomma pulvis-pyrius CBS 109.77]|uniref:PLAC8-domain-containing protein n=1 Tax=Melanomma pulvis-pyrius CBS 109.77 TaxID=1314802 RepID=A0A6A6XTV3_9PLEO|nr:PLAC8-domain-containing protein [Melanomma pulvis-pyrius CBS 109.77]